MGPGEDGMVPMLALGMVERVAYCLRMMMRTEQFMAERTEYNLIYILLVEVQVNTQLNSKVPVGILNNAASERPHAKKQI